MEDFHGKHNLKVVMVVSCGKVFISLKPTTRKIYHYERAHNYLKRIQQKATFSLLFTNQDLIKCVCYGDILNSLNTPTIQPSNHPTIQHLARVALMKPGFFTRQNIGTCTGTFLYLPVVHILT